MTMMDERDNFLRILRFEQPERIISQLPIDSVTYYGMDHQGFENSLGDDSPIGSRWVDIWGTGWHKLQPGVMGMPEINPLERPEALKAYQWPDPQDPRLIDPIYSQARAFSGSQRLLACHHRDTLWEKAYMLVGMETMMMAFIDVPDFAHEVLRHIMDFQIAIARHYLDVGVEMAFLGDDLGSQRGPLLGPRIVNAFLRPEYQRLFDLYRQNHVLIGFHSCGNVASVVDMFMELGVNLLNPVQATANDLDWLRQKTRGRMALQGGVSSGILMSGPIKDIQDEARQRLWQLGRNGGYVCQPDQSLPYPEAHLQALEDTIERFGNYPISLA